MITRGTYRSPLSSLRKNFLAALAFRLLCTRDVEDVAVLVNRPPQVVLDTVDADEHLIKVPLVPGTGPAATQGAGVGLPELPAPAPDRLVGDHHAAGEHEFLGLPEREQEPVVEPHTVRDDLDRVAVALVRRRGSAHAPSSQQPTANVTVPLEQGPADLVDAGTSGKSGFL